MLDLKEYGIVLQNNKSVPYARINIIAYTIARRPNKTAIGKITLIIIEGNSHSVVRYVPTVGIHRIGQEDAVERSVLYLRQLQVIGVTARQHRSLWVGVRHLGTKRGHRLCHTHKGHEHQNQERYVSHAL